MSSLDILQKAVDARLVTANFDVITNPHPFGDERELRARRLLENEMGRPSKNTIAGFEINIPSGHIDGSLATSGSQYGVFVHSPIKDAIFAWASSKSSSYKKLTKDQRNSFEEIRAPLTVLHEGAHLDMNQNLMPYFFAMRNYAAADKKLSVQQNELFSNPEFITNFKESSADVAAVIMALKLGVINKENTGSQIETLMAFRESATDIAHRTGFSLKALKEIDPQELLSMPNDKVVKFATDLAFKSTLQRFSTQLPPEYSFASFSGMPLNRVEYPIASETEIEKIGTQLRVHPTCIDDEPVGNNIVPFGINRKFFENKRPSNSDDELKRNRSLLMNLK